MKQLKEYIITENNFFKNLGIGMVARIEKWLNENYIKNYTINDDLTIDVKGDVDLHRYGERELPEYIQFGKIKGNFDIYSSSDLISLRGCPREVSGSFSCSECYNLKSLDGCPQIVKDGFYCSYCHSLTSLEGAPKIVGKDFRCLNCDSLE
jgi:hypothetical protein